MDQVSRPMLIALAATVVLAALWLVALRPKAPEVADTPAAPVTDIAQARDAAATSDTANEKVAGAADRTGTATSTTVTAPTSPASPGATVATKPATKAAARAPADAAAARRDAPVMRDIRRGKVVVLLFWSAKSADDVATRDAVRGLSRRGGKVAVHTVPISRVAQFASITRGVTVNQSPTALVIDRKQRARVIVGLAERVELSQAVDDALAGRH